MQRKSQPLLGESSGSSFESAKRVLLATSSAVRGDPRETLSSTFPSAGGAAVRGCQLLAATLPVKFWRDGSLAQGLRSALGFFSFQFWADLGASSRALTVCAEALVLVTAALLALVSFRSTQVGVSSAWYTRAARRLWPLLAGVLAVPVIGVLAETCSFSQRSSHVRMHDEAAWPAPSERAIAGLALCIAMPLALLGSLLLYTPNPLGKCWSARPHARFDTLLLALHATWTLLVALAPDSSAWLAGLSLSMAAASCALVVVHALFAPWYDAVANKLNAAALGATAGGALAGFFAAVYDASSGESKWPLEFIAVLWLLLGALGAWASLRLLALFQDFYLAQPTQRAQLPLTRLLSWAREWLQRRGLGAGWRWVAVLSTQELAARCDIAGDVAEIEDAVCSVVRARLSLQSDKEVAAVGPAAPRSVAAAASITDAASSRSRASPSLSGAGAPLLPSRDAVHIAVSDESERHQSDVQPQQQAQPPRERDALWWLPTAFHGELCTRGLFTSDADEDALRVAEIAFAATASLFPESLLPSLLRLYHRWFRAPQSRAAAKQLAATLHRQNADKDTPFLEKLDSLAAAHCLGSARGKGGEAASLLYGGGGGGDADDEMEADRAQMEVEAARLEMDEREKRLLDALISFWSLLRSEDMDLEQMDSVARQAVALEDEGFAFVSALKKRFPQTPAVLRLYGRFLLTYRENPEEGEEALARADQLEESAARGTLPTAGGGVSAPERGQLGGDLQEESPEQRARAQLSPARRSAFERFATEAAAAAAGAEPPSQQEDADVLEWKQAHEAQAGDGAAPSAQAEHKEEEAEAEVAAAAELLVVEAPEAPFRPRRDSEPDSASPRERKISILKLEKTSPRGARAALSPARRQMTQGRELPSPTGSGGGGGGGGWAASDRKSVNSGSTASQSRATRVRSRWHATMTKLKQEKNSSFGISRLKNIVCCAVVIISVFCGLSFFVNTATLDGFKVNAEHSLRVSAASHESWLALTSSLDLDIALRFSNTSRPSFNGSDAIAPHWTLPLTTLQAFAPFVTNETAARESLVQHADRVQEAVRLLTIGRNVLKGYTMRAVLDEERYISLYALSDGLTFLRVANDNLLDAIGAFARHARALAQLSLRDWAASASAAHPWRGASLAGQPDYWYNAWNPVEPAWDRALRAIKEDWWINTDMLSVAVALVFFLTCFLVLVLASLTLRNAVDYVSAEKMAILSALAHLPPKVVNDRVNFFLTYKQKLDGDGDEQQVRDDDAAAGPGAASAAAAASNAMENKGAATGGGRLGQRKRTIKLRESPQIRRLHTKYLAAFFVVLVMQIVCLVIAKNHNDLDTMYHFQAEVAANRSVAVGCLGYFTRLTGSASNFSDSDASAQRRLVGEAQTSSVPLSPLLNSAGSARCLNSLIETHNAVLYGYDGSLLQPTFGQNPILDRIHFGDLCGEPAADVDCSVLSPQLTQLASGGLHSVVLAYVEAATKFLHASAFDAESFALLEALHAPDGVLTRASRAATRQLQVKLEENLSSGRANQQTLLIVSLVVIVAGFVLIFHPMVAFLEEENRITKLAFFLVPIDAVMSTPSILRVIGLNASDLGIRASGSQDSTRASPRGKLHVTVTDASLAVSEDAPAAAGLDSSPAVAATPVAAAAHADAVSAELAKAGPSSSQPASPRSAGGASPPDALLVPATAPPAKSRAIGRALRVAFLALAVFAAVYGASVATWWRGKALNFVSHGVLLLTAAADAASSALVPCSHGGLSQFVLLFTEGLSSEETVTWVTLTQAWASPVLALALLLAPETRRLLAMRALAYTVPLCCACVAIATMTFAKVMIPFPFTPPEAHVFRDGIFFGALLGLLSERVLVSGAPTGAGAGSGAAGGSNMNLGSESASAAAARFAFSAANCGELFIFAAGAAVLEASGGSGSGLALFLFLRAYYRLPFETASLSGFVLQSAASITHALARVYGAGRSPGDVVTDLVVSRTLIALPVIALVQLVATQTLARVHSVMGSKSARSLQHVGLGLAFLVTLTAFLMSFGLIVVEREASQRALLASLSAATLAAVVFMLQTAGALRAEAQNLRANSA